MQQQTIPASRSLLKICGVLMILFGAIFGLVYLLGFAGVFALNYATQGVFSANRDLIGLGLLAASSLVELIAGILGSRAAKRPQRAGKSLLVWGALCLLLTIAGVGSIILRGDTIPLWEPIAALLLGAVTPIVYLVSSASLLSADRTAAEADAEDGTEEDGEDA